MCKYHPFYKWTCKNFIEMNIFKIVSFNKINQITILKLFSSKNIASLKFSSLQLKYLSCWNCEMKYFPDSIDTPNLVYLNLSKNHIRDIYNLTRKAFMILQYLDLSRNPLKDFQPFHSMSNLIFLDLSYSSITFLTKNQFKFTTNLEIFKLIHCNIRQIQKSSFKEIHSLKELYLNFTKLPLGKESFLIENQKKLEILFSEYYSLCCYAFSSNLNMTKCCPSKATFSSCSDLLENDYVRSLYWIIGLIGIIGNLCSIYFRLISFQKPTHMFFLFLSIADFFTALYLLIIS